MRMGCIERKPGAAPDEASGEILAASDCVQYCSQPTHTVADLVVVDRSVAMVTPVLCVQPHVSLISGLRRWRNLTTNSMTIPLQVSRRRIHIDFPTHPTHPKPPQTTARHRRPHDEADVSAPAAAPRFVPLDR